ncbi:MAG TPA: hypothetical protein ENK72_02300 [Epsilonproteobacteria bacterium]|nr:hypothetical protein [Campylobacterota bacterium]
MQMMGMVSRYFSESGTGSLVLSDGEIREFTREQWTDTEWEPGIGQKVLYTSDQNGTQLRTITEEEVEALKNMPSEEEPEVAKPAEEVSAEPAFSSSEEAIAYYISAGFKKASKREVNGIRTISMRYYDQGEFGEAVITVNGAHIEIKETRNGQPV